MPGVPSGRGCDACRKQKKKCDVEIFPCSRCRRLSIDCIGHGQQRYKFKNETPNLILTQRPTPNQQILVVQPTRDLSNRLSSLTSAFIHSIGQEVDIRFQLTWNFGDFLAGIPCRLGRSAALDAATDALVAAHTGYCAGNLASSPVVWAKYSRALSVLRHDLDDVAKARSSESLCAVMVITIAQLLIDPSNDHAMSHTEGAAQIMKHRGFVEPRDDFERLLIYTLRGPVVFEALLTDKICFSSRDWQTFNDQGPEPQTLPDGQWFNCIAAIPDLMQRSKAALILHDPPSLHLLGLELETRSLLEDCNPIITTLRERLQAYDPSSKPGELRDHIHAHYLRSLGLALGTGIVLNCVLGGLEGTSDCICEASSLWSEEIIHLSQAATKYRPLGSMAMLLCLRIAWMGATSDDAKERIEALLHDYTIACLGIPTEGQRAGLTRGMRRFTLQDY